MVELAPDMFVFLAAFLAIGERWVLYLLPARGTSTTGAAVTFDSLGLVQLAHGAAVAGETFLPEQLAEAWARFDELEAEGDGHTPSVD